MQLDQVKFLGTEPIHIYGPLAQIVVQPSLDNSFLINLVWIVERVMSLLLDRLLQRIVYRAKLFKIVLGFSFPLEILRSEIRSAALTNVDLSVPVCRGATHIPRYRAAPIMVT